VLLNNQVQSSGRGLSDASSWIWEMLPELAGMVQQLYVFMLNEPLSNGY